VTNRTARNAVLAWVGPIGWQAINVPVVGKVGPGVCLRLILPVIRPGRGFADEAGTWTGPVGQLDRVRASAALLIVSG